MNYSRLLSDTTLSSHPLAPPSEVQSRHNNAANSNAYRHLGSLQRLSGKGTFFSPLMQGKLSRARPWTSITAIFLRLLEGIQHDGATMSLCDKMSANMNDMSIIHLQFSLKCVRQQSKFYSANTIKFVLISPTQIYSKNGTTASLNIHSENCVLICSYGIFLIMEDIQYVKKNSA